MTWFLIIFNKITLIGIGIWVIWALQALIKHPEVQNRYPFTRSIILRLGLTLIGVAVAMDFFAYYVPSISEVILNAGMLAVKGFVYYSFSTGHLTSNNGRLKSKL